MSDARDTRAPARQGYEMLEHTADEAIRAWGPDLGALFAAAARGLFALIADVEAVRPVTERRIELRAESREALLHDWLEELNGLHQVQGELYCAFDVDTDGERLTATIHGEAIDPSRHELRGEVKAVTWHDLAIEETADGLCARVLFDV